MSNLKAEYKSKLKYVNERLASRADSLARDMDFLAEKIRRDPTSPTVNELGEVQSRGSDIDRLCATRGLLLEFIDRIEYEEAREEASI